MNDENGYIYILINPSLKNLIKIGKTTRDVDERAKELSGSTGIPTPFVVAYQMFVKNCSEAEKYVHARLDLNGLRVNDNREFFYATITDAINIFIEYKNIEDINKNEKNNIKKNHSSKPFDFLEKDGDKYYFGLEDFLQNYKLALTNYKKAMQLGSCTAPGKIGRMYTLGEGCKKNIDTAISYFLTGTQRNDNKCYPYLMEVYLITNNIRNFLKCWINADNFNVNIPISLIDEYLYKTIELNLTVGNRELLYKIKDELINYQKNKEHTKANRVHDINYTYQPLLYAQYVLNLPFTAEILTGGNYISQYINERDKILGITKLPPIRIKGIDY